MCCLCLLRTNRAKLEEVVVVITLLSTGTARINTQFKFLVAALCCEKSV